MNYIKVNSLDKYQHYKDRNMIWFKWYVDCLQDYKLSKLEDHQKWLFIGLICLACKTHNKIPLDYNWIKNQLSLSEKSIEKDIKSLIDSEMLSLCNQDAIPIREDKRREDKIREEKNDFVAFEKATIETWNRFCLKYPVFPKIVAMSEKRRKKLKLRFGEKAFREAFENLSIYTAIEKQPFLHGESDRGWRLNFNWLIDNDTNYLKVIEYTYLKRR